MIEIPILGAILIAILGTALLAGVAWLVVLILDILNS